MATARYFLQVPPVLLAKKDEHVILSKDPALQGLEESKILFTDISFGVPHPVSYIVCHPFVLFLILKFSVLPCKFCALHPRTGWLLPEIQMGLCAMHLERNAIA